jgi:sugar-specific transcriptional regulator TrmB
MDLTARMLEAIGLDEDEERVYKVLLQRPATSIQALTSDLRLTRRQVQGALAALGDKGLVSAMPGRPARYMPAAPEVAVEPLIHRRQEELERVRLAASELSRTFRSAAQAVSPVEVVQVISGQEAVVQHFLQLQHASEKEILAFVRPPFALEPVENTETELKVASRGVRSRTVYDAGGLDAPGRMKLIAVVEEAEEARVYPAVPLKLVIFDRNLALVPLWLEEAEVRAALLVRQSPLLDSLVALFELVWERSVPIHAHSEAGQRASSRDGDRELITLLAAGLKDQAIARHLGIGMSTVARRVRRLMDAMEVRTRFQAGLQAGRLGWIGARVSPEDLTE